jgi:4-phytase/acid phosphatase
VTINHGTAELSGPLNIASTFTENLLLEYANGMEGKDLGWGRLDAHNLLHIMKLHTTYADLMRRTPYLASARSSNLLVHVLRSMEQAVAGRRVDGAIGAVTDHVLLLSGHDTNLSNVSGMLDLSWQLPGYERDDTPPGGALVVALREDATSHEYFVDLEYLAQTLPQMRRLTPLTLMFRVATTPRR